MHTNESRYTYTLIQDASKQEKLIADERAAHERDKADLEARLEYVFSSVCVSLSNSFVNMYIYANTYTWTYICVYRPTLRHA